MKPPAYIYFLKVGNKSRCIDNQLVIWGTFSCLICFSFLSHWLFFGVGVDRGLLQFWNSVLYSLSLTESYSYKNWKEVRAITLNYLFPGHKKRVKFSQQSLRHSNPACKTYILQSCERICFPRCDAGLRPWRSLLIAGPFSCELTG